MMKKLKLLSLVAATTCAVGICLFTLMNVEGTNAHAASFDSDDYYSLLATAIDASDTNAFEDNKNPQIFDSSNDVFKNAISIRKDVDTYASSIESGSAFEFSNKYAKTFSSTIETSVDVQVVATDISGKFDTNVNTEFWKQKIESYEYYYWFAQKYIVNIDWKQGNINEAFSQSFKRELANVNSVVRAKELLREYGTHVYKNYVLGGKMEITKYFTQDASYELSETERTVASSLNVIVDTAKVDAKINGSVNLSTYESNSFSSSSYYSKLGYHAYGGDTNGALTASDLFQYKTQFGTGYESGFLYEAWTKSFNNDGVSLKVVSAENAVAIWDILDSSEYSSQISYLKKAWDNMCYESYAKKCSEFRIPCDYIETLEYTSKGTKVSITPYDSSIKLPENTEVKINLSDLVTGEFGQDQYSLSLSSESAATLEDDTLKIKGGTTGRSFNIELQIEGIKAYSLGVIIEEEKLGGGYGTQQQPYLINTKPDLLSLLRDTSSSNNFYKLSNDIDLAGEKLDVGGSGTSSAFTGTLDGDGHSIKNCTVITSSFSNGFAYIGLFGKNEGTIKNLIIDNVICLTNGLVVINNSNISLSAGVLTGYNAGVIHNCLIKDSAIRISTDIVKDTASLNVGGIAGYSEGIVEYSAFTNGNIYGIATKGKGNISVGGIVGQLAGSKITQSYVNNSKIYVSNQDSTKFSMGGIAGRMVIRTAEDTSVINPKLSMCLVYSVSKNNDGNTFGYIAGTEEHGEFANCYFTALKDVSVAGGSKNNCIRKDNLSIPSLPSVFHDEWEDGRDGPVLKMHVN